MIVCTLKTYCLSKYAIGLTYKKNSSRYNFDIFVCFLSTMGTAGGEGQNINVKVFKCKKLVLRVAMIPR